MGVAMRLTFHFAIYKDEPLALRLAAQLRSHYPDSDIIAVTDGPAHLSTMNRLMTEYGVIACQGQHLKQWGMGGAAAHRNLQAVLAETSADMLIQMDPDAYLWRPFAAIPQSDWFGQRHISQCTWYPHTPMPCVHGAAWGMSREMALAAIDSELLLDPMYSTSKTLWGYRLKRDGDRFIPRLDLIWGHVAAELGIVPECWDDVKGGLLAGSHNLYDWAVTHPVIETP